MTGPKPESAYDRNFQLTTEYYAKSATFKVPLSVDAAAKAGPVEAVIAVRFQACDDRTCLPPSRVQVPLSLKIVVR